MARFLAGIAGEPGKLMVALFSLQASYAAHLDGPQQRQGAGSAAVRTVPARGRCASSVKISDAAALC